MISYRDLARASVLSKPVYQPGKPIALVARECGLDPDSVLKLASNENPLGPSPLALAAARRALPEVHLYPEDSTLFLREKLAGRYGLSVDQFFVGNGSNEIFDLLAAIFAGPGRDVVMGEHAFIAYKIAALTYESRCIEVPLRDFRHDLPAMARAVTPETRLVYLPSPNNPTGTGNTEEEVTAFLEQLPDHVVFCFDQAYAEYIDRPPDLRPHIRRGRKVICTRTFSKIYGLAGMRIGYAYADAELISLLNRARLAFNVNSVALAAAEAALDDEEFVERSREVNRVGLDQLGEGFAQLGLETVPSQGNFILVRFSDSDRVFNTLHDRGIIVRPLKGYALPAHLRVTVGAEAQNRILLAAVAECLGVGAK